MVTTRFATAGLALIVLLFVFSCRKEKPGEVRFRANEFPAACYEMVYVSGNWQHPDYGKPFTSLGNHRIVLEVDDSISGPVQVVIPWRRPDPDPERKAVLVAVEETGELLVGKQVCEINREFCHLVFQPADGQSRYYVYYLPHQSTGGHYPELSYIRPGETPDTTGKLTLNDDEVALLPHATIISVQSIDDFHSFFPMEVIATESEVQSFIRDHPAPFYLFPEYSRNPVKMDHHLPLHWVGCGGPANGLKDTAKKGTYYTFQVGVWSPSHTLSNIRLTFSDLVSENDTLPANAGSCFNAGGTGLNGQPFTKSLDIPKSKIQSLWCGYDLPADLKAGEYSGRVIIRPRKLEPDTIFLLLEITENIGEKNDDINPYNMSRLKWLNSTIGSSMDFIARPFIPVEVRDRNIRILGREIELDSLGFPSGIFSSFAPEMTRLSKSKEPLLAAPVRIEIQDASGKPILWKSENYSVKRESPGSVTWNTTNTSSPLVMEVAGNMEYDGMLDYRILLTAKEDTEIKDFVLHIPLLGTAAEYMLGLGLKGGKTPEIIDWKWDVAIHHQEGAWLGTVNKGIQFVLRDELYERPLNTNFYRQKPLHAPLSWYNDGKGGIRIRNRGDFISVENYSGSRTMKSGDTLCFNVRFLITPFKLIDTKAHFTTRFVHKYVPVDSVVAWNGTIVNVHHANEINPYINYPVYNVELQKAYIDEAHRKGIKVKLYNTIRELTYKAHELFALRSLGDEILNDGEGGGHSWLQEHLRSHYHSAWHATSVNDAAILNKGTSRWTNYYIEGVNWLAENQQIDGLYLDDIAFSRTTVKRLANVLQQHREEVVIDLHSANQFNARDGYINSAFLYMEHMPYITRLWFGEYFEYDLGPDYWLTEVSGIPFGLTGEMLEGGGHPWRGLVYGMTSRIYGDSDPRPLWKLIDHYDLAGSEMLGYWVDHSPVKTDVENIRSTAYIHNRHVLIAIGSWSEKDEQVALLIDWKALGMERENVRLFSPPIEGLQPEQALDIHQPLNVEKMQGKVVVLERIK